MFKKVILITAALAFGFGILTTSVLRTSAQIRSENYQVLPAATESGQTPTPATEVKKKVDYYLPYPGILPDHFLYPIKMIRDRILVFFTANPLKRAELFLLFADKRIGAAKSLVEGGKKELGVTTLTKAEKYLEKVVNQEKMAREKGKDTIAFLEKMGKASLKHEELLLEIKEKVGESGQKAVDDALSYPRRAYEQVMERLKK